MEELAACAPLQSWGGKILRFQGAGFHPKRRCAPQRRGIPQTQFHLQILPIHLDCLRADPQLRADLKGAAAGHAGAEVDTSSEHGPDGGEHRFGGLGLHQVAAGASLQGAVRLDILVKLRQGDDPDFRMLPHHHRHQLEPLAIGQAQVHEDHVGGLVCDRLPGFGETSGFLAAGHPFLLAEPRGEAAAEEGVVSDHENADFFHESDFSFSLTAPPGAKAYGVGVTIRRRNFLAPSIDTRKRCSPGVTLVSVIGCQSPAWSVVLHSAP